MYYIDYCQPDPDCFSNEFTRYFSFSYGGLQVISSIALAVIVERKRFKQLKIESNNYDIQFKDLSHEILVLPIYFVLLRATAIVILLQGLSNFCPSRSQTKVDCQNFCFVIHGISHGLHHLVFDGVAMFVSQYGSGIRTIKLILRYAILWGIFTSFLWYVVLKYQAKIVEFVFEISLSIIYSIFWLSPADRLFRRPSVLSYSFFFCFAWFARATIQFFDTWYPYAYLSEVIEVFVGIFWGIIRPLVLYNLLYLDSLYWQGCFPANSGPQTYWKVLLQNKSVIKHDYSATPLLGFDVMKHSPQLQPDSARQLAANVDYSGRRFGTVGNLRLLNFATLKLGGGTVIGAGGTAKVFIGTLDSSPVAVKMLIPADITPEQVEKFLQESSILAQLRHPNIIEVRGVCIVPPSLCLCMELATRGSLHKELDLNFSSLDWPMKHKMAIDCVRAVDYLHSNVPVILHNDIKSMNFFVKADGVIKLGDFDFAVFGDSPDKAHRVPDTVNWLAPEVISLKKVSKASDVYALGMVLWEIGSGKVPFSEVDDPFELILRNERPIIPIDWPTPYGALITQCWEADHTHRPTASEMLIILESLREVMKSKTSADRVMRGSIIKPQTEET